jgi:hypothetical protein
MAQIHVISGGTNGIYTAVVHANTPAGNNSVGTPWATAIVNSRSASASVSVLTEGTGPGQITTAELAALTNGTVIEGVFQWQDDPNWTNPQRVTDLTLRASQLMANLLSETQARLKYFGYST